MLGYPVPPKVAQGMPNYVMEAVQLRRIQTEGVVCTYIYYIYVYVYVYINIYKYAYI